MQIDFSLLPICQDPNMQISSSHGYFIREAAKNRGWLATKINMFLNFFFHFVPNLKYNDLLVLYLYVERSLLSMINIFSLPMHLFYYFHMVLVGNSEIGANVRSNTYLFVI